MRRNQEKYDNFLKLLESAEIEVYRRECQLKLAERKLEEALSLIEALFQNGEEAVIEVKENENWKMIGYANNSKGRSTNPSKEYKVFNSKEAARSSKLFNRLETSGMIFGKDFRISTKDGPKD